MKYSREFVPAANLTLLIMEEVYRILGAADIYHIHCGEHEFYDVRLILEKGVRNQPSSPFSPVVNISMDDSLKKREWYIEAIRLDTGGIKSIGCVAF